MNIILYITGFVFAISTAFFLAGFPGTISAGSGKKCTHKNTSALVRAAKKNRKRSLILMLISAVILLYVFFHTSRIAAPYLPGMTTIGQFSDEIAALADQTPTGLIYTESIGSPDTFTVTVDDPAVAKEVLDIILNTSVNRQGCQVDMYQMQYEEYCFVFDGETCTFSFLPHSYFCYDAQYYELGENQLSRVCSFLHEDSDSSEPSETADPGTAAEPQSNWYGDDAVLQTNFVDNGDEARSLTELTLSAGEECLTEVIEGAYDVLSVDKQPDGYVIRYTYGDFYSHEETRSSRITVENGKMVITDIEQYSR